MKPGHVSQKRKRMTSRKPRKRGPVSPRVHAGLQCHKHETISTEQKGNNVQPFNESLRNEDMMMMMMMKLLPTLQTAWKHCSKVIRKWFDISYIKILFLFTVSSNWFWSEDLLKGSGSDEAQTVQEISRRGRVLRLPCLTRRCGPSMNDV